MSDNFGTETSSMSAMILESASVGLEVWLASQGGRVFECFCTCCPRGNVARVLFFAFSARVSGNMR